MNPSYRARLVQMLVRLKDRDGGGVRLRTLLDEQQIAHRVGKEEEQQLDKEDPWSVKDDDAYLVAFRLNLKLEN